MPQTSALQKVFWGFVAIIKNTVKFIERVGESIMRYLVIAVLALLPSISFAEGSGNREILRVEVGDGGFNIYAVEGNFGSALCAGGEASTVNNPISFKQQDFPNGYAHMLSTALSAYMAGKKVSMWYVGCQDSPWGNGRMPKPSTIVVR